MKEGSSRHCCLLQHRWWQDTSSKVAILSDMATTLAAMLQLLLLSRNLEKRRPHAPFQSTRLRYTWVWSTQFRRKRTRESKFRYTTIDKSKSCIIQNQPIPYKYIQIQYVWAPTVACPIWCTVLRSFQQATLRDCQLQWVRSSLSQVLNVNGVRWVRLFNGNFVTTLFASICRISVKGIY